jgi:hypothetical protein
MWQSGLGRDSFRTLVRRSDHFVHTASAGRYLLTWFRAYQCVCGTPCKLRLTIFLCLLQLFVSVVAAVFLTPTFALGATATASWVPAPLNAEGSNPATTFHIERKLGTCASTTGTFIEIGTTVGTVRSFVDTTVQIGVPYCYRMAAGNPSGKSEFSPEVDFIRPLVPPGTPTGLVVTPGS